MKDLSLDLMRDRLNLSYVKRWVIAPTHAHQSVAEHTFRVLAIALYLADQLNWRGTGNVSLRMRLILGVIDHDLEEVYTGDIPGPTKDEKGQSGLKPIEGMTDIQCLLKVADSIETGTFWVVWGNPKWNHRHNNAPARDLAKMRHYGAKIPGLVTAAEEAWDAIAHGQ